MNDKVIIYHADCWDGFAAYWVCTMVPGWEDAKGIPMNYGDKIDTSEILDKDVLMVDFSMPRDDLVRIHDAAKSFRVYDHHKTAEEELKDLDFAYFDSSRSGAMIAYEEILKGPSEGVVKTACEYIQDRDLWKWELTHSKEIHAWLRSELMTFKTLNEFCSVEGFDMWRELTSRGAQVLKAQQQIIDAHIEHARPITLLDDFSKPESRATEGLIVNNTTPGLASEIAGALAEKSGTFGATWAINDDKAIVSLRSRKTKINRDLDVSTIAKGYGGGGHKNAAGFHINPHRS